MKELLSANWPLVVARGFLAVLFGVMAVVWPGITLLSLVFLFGIYALIDGFTSVFVGLSRLSGERWIPLASGGLGILTGILVLAWPGISAVVLLVFVAIWALIIGFSQLWSALRLHGDFTGRALMALSGVAIVALAVYMLAQPGQGAVALVFGIGFLAIVWGLFTVALGFRMRSVARQLEQVDTTESSPVL
ncbi:HdeD family acid-resistance protein [Natronoglycomyces albus]|uniref:DUF308 domain-containing protein n=1 Tax=Natronoglycomyces albus TaxID=2811108 RepID=A0A895XRG5_9ACTN|nr:DUF308 domain-containing protein [Natronoglycomyces albus]QSB04850.1 DUF308 domain-containing protein [Natronoglycomyces albus]